MPLPLEGIGSRYGAMPKQELIHVRPQTVSPGPWCTSGEAPRTRVSLTYWLRMNG